MADSNNIESDDQMEDAQQGEPVIDNRKPQKAPKPPPPPQRAVVPEYRIETKKKKGGLLKVILLIVLLLLIAGFVFEEVYFNYLGTRDIVVDALVAFDPTYKTRDELLAVREDEVGRKKAELDTRERSVASKESQNARRGAELDKREEELRELEQYLIPLHLREMTEQELADMQSISKSYSLMPPESAADILNEIIYPDDVAAILYYMNERKAAAILAVMDPEFSARITEILLYK